MQFPRGMNEGGFFGVLFLFLLLSAASSSSSSTVLSKPQVGVLLQRQRGDFSLDGLSALKKKRKKSPSNRKRFVAAAETESCHPGLCKADEE